MIERNPLDSEYQAVVEQIQAMFERDQDMRQRAMTNDGVIETEKDNQLDVVNTDNMRSIVERIGWPTISKVGETVAHQAWLLVQHADHDLAWQKVCLELMKGQPEGEVSPIDIAYLEDRVRVNEGQPQLYGTQFHGEGQNYRPRPIEDEELVDERRSKIGMETLAEYTRELKERYQEE